MGFHPFLLHRGDAAHFGFCRVDGGVDDLDAGGGIDLIGFGRHPADRIGGAAELTAVGERLVIGEHLIGGVAEELLTGVHENVLTSQAAVPHAFGGDVPERPPHGEAGAVFAVGGAGTLVVIDVGRPIVFPQLLVAGGYVPLYPGDFRPRGLIRGNAVPFPDGDGLDAGLLDIAFEVVQPGLGIGIVGDGIVSALILL